MLKLFTIGFCLLFYLPAQSQILDEWDESNENFLYRVKNISAFIDRFNFSKDVNGEKAKPYPSESDSLLEYINNRKMSLFSLFDHDKLPYLDDEQKEVIRSFIMHINNPEDPTFISFYDDNWYAVLEMKVIFGGLDDTMLFVLQNKTFRPRVSAWIIRSIYSKKLSLEETHSGSDFWIAPNSDGTDFIELKQKLSYKSTINELLKTKEWADSQLLPYLLSGDLKFQHIQLITYHFLNIPGYKITVKEKRGDSKNAGWLIDEVQLFNEQQKSTFYKNIMRLGD